MALIKCPECGKEISDKALACPNCGMPLRSEDRGTYNVTIHREKQWFLINPKTKITVDNVEEYEVGSGEEIVIPMTTGKHTILFTMSPKKTQADIEVIENLDLYMKINRTWGEIEVTGRGITTVNNSPKISVGFGVGGSSLQ